MESVSGDDEALRRRALAAARRWRRHVEGVSLTRTSGGMSSITYLLDLHTGEKSTRTVLKVAPRGLTPTGSRDVLRQARIMTILAGKTGIAVPAVLAEDAGSTLDEPPFFVMSFCPGDSYEPVLDPVAPTPVTADLVSDRAAAAAGTLARMHQLDLTGLDEPATSLHEEVHRWRHAFATVPEDLSRGAAAAASMLLADLPRPDRPSLVHGDFRLGNVLFEGSRVSAVIDWELWNVSDRRIDLAWLLLLATPDDLPLADEPAIALPPSETILAAYTASGRVPDLDWFRALVQFRYAATLALIVKRRRKTEAGSAAQERRARRVRLMLENVVRFLT